MPISRPSVLSAALALAVSACGPASSPSPSPAAVAETPAATGAALAGAAEGGNAGASAGADAGTVSGAVAETMNSGGYTYARLTRNGTDTWMAAPEILTIKVGDQLTGTVSQPMDQFHSRTLNRDFERIYFVSRVTRNGEVLNPAPESSAGLSMAGSHGGDAPAPAAAPQVTESIAPAPGGVKVADVWAKREALSGKPIVVRGKVVKANYEIMGVNWYHVQDGSGTATDGTNDLTITSDAQVKVGDIVTVSGTLVTQKDFGAGYAYDAIVEKAEIKK